MTYNTVKERLKMPEYGRSVQDMIHIATQLPTKEERQLCAESIAEIMHGISGNTKQDDSEQRIWDHIAYISDYQLDIDYPYPITRLDDKDTRPEPLHYPTHKIHHQQYGHLIEEVLVKLEQMEEGDERQELLTLVANQMRLCLYNWNKDATSCEKVATDIYNYTHGAIELDIDSIEWGPLYSLPKADSSKKKKRK